MLIQQKLPDNNEIGRVTVGVPGLNAQFPFRASLLGRVKKYFTRPLLSDAVKAVALRCHVHIFADDEGVATLYLTVANMSRDAVTIERVFLDTIAANSNSLNSPPPSFTPPRESLPPMTWQEVGLRIVLGAPSIRHLLSVIQRAQNTLSSPTVEIFADGVIELRYRGKQERIGFATADRRPHLIITCPGAQVTR